MFMPFVKQILCRSKVYDVFIRDVAYLFSEELKILTFCKSRKLTIVADSHIYQLFHTIISN